MIERSNENLKSFQRNLPGTHLEEHIIIIFRTAFDESHRPVDIGGCLVRDLYIVAIEASTNATVAFVRSPRSTYSGKTLRRSIIVIGMITLVLLAFQTGWEATQFLNPKNETPFRALWSTFSGSTLMDSTIWFNALVQVLFSTNIGVGVLPVVTGKFLYKGDAVR